MFQFLRTNPGVLITLLLMGACLFVCAILGFFMKRGGASLRPIYWFAGFFALVVLPQFLGQLYGAIRNSKIDAPHSAALDQISSQEEKASAGSEMPAPAGEIKQLFGPDADPQLIVDVRNSFGGVFTDAETAQFATLPNGDTVLLARFAGYSAAEKAWVKYLQVAGLSSLGGKGNSQRGYLVTRPVGDRAYALHMRNMVGVWTGATDDAVRKRMEAGGFAIPSNAPFTVPDVTRNRQPILAQKNGPKTPFGLGPTAAGLALYLFLVVLYFFKGAAWASSASAAPGIVPVSAQELAQRIESINSLEVPLRIEPGTTAGEWVATWRYADAKWVDLARARGLRRTFRIRLRLDEKDRVVRATDYVSGYDWSAGGGGAEFAWKAMLGITFFQYEHQRVLGLQLDEKTGAFKPALSYAYTFNLQEMKSPLVQAVTRSGWTWRPTLWQGPRWLRWLTE